MIPKYERMYNMFDKIPYERMNEMTDKEIDDILNA